MTERRDHIPITEFRAVIRDMRFLSYGTTGSFEGRVTGSKERPLYPSGEMRPLFDEFEARWRGARSVQAKRAVLVDARDALEKWKHGSKPPVDSEAWREMVGTQGGKAADVAKEWGISASRVYQLRQKYRKEAA